MDKRGKKILYLSQCLLNQNLRFPGIAVKSGALTELINSLIKNGVGIEPLPCLERLGWGGVKRITFFKYFPLLSRNLESKKFPLIRLFLKIWLRNYRKLCKKEAKRIIRQIIDYIDSGFSILGIIVTNDSPTCGYSKTINLLKILSRSNEIESLSEIIENPTLDKMKEVIPSLCENGAGYFTNELLKQMKKKNLHIDIIGFNIWNNLIEEANVVLKKLNLYEPNET